MTVLKKTLFKLFWVGCGLFFTINLHANQDVKIFNTSQNGLTIELSPALQSIDSIKLANQHYYKINLKLHQQTGEPGNPLIPARVLNVGIPNGADVRVSVANVNFTEIRGRLLPAPQIDDQGNYNYQENVSTYQDGGFQPQDVLQTSEVAFFRDQRFVKLIIKPVQFNSNTNRIKIANHLTIRVDFIGSNFEMQDAPPNKKEDELYRGVIVNYDQSKKWLKPRQKRILRKQSGLVSGEWFKIVTEQEGIYKVTGNDLKSVGVDLAGVDPTTIRVYNNGGRELPRAINTTREDSLIENAIYVVGEDDGEFNENDYILFFGRPVNYWQPENDTSVFFKHYINHYTYQNVYWLTWGNNQNGKRMQTRSAIQSEELPVYDFFSRYYDEDEINNIYHSGIEWFGRLLAGNQTESYSLYLPHPNNIDNNAHLTLSVFGLTSGTHRFSLYFNDEFVESFSFSGNRIETHEFTTTLRLAESGYNNLKIQYNGFSPENQVYVDWFEVHYRRKFIAESNYLWFIQDEDGPQKYRISNFASNQIKVFDVTNWQDIEMVTDIDISAGSVIFTDDVTGFPRHQYIAVSEEAYWKPVDIQRVNFADLRNVTNAADFIIVTHEDFYDAIIPLKERRETKDSLKTMIVKISDIYNEFSWGLIDPTALRDFLKFTYDNWNLTPRYVLFCGDGDYDYKNIVSDADKNWLPPYQSDELNKNSNRTSDDWFVTVSGDDSEPDMAIGRFPVQTFEEVQNVVKKIIDYENMTFWSEDQPEILDDWRNVITMVGDDEITGKLNANETMHTNDAENIIENSIPNSFEKDKVYLIEYPKVVDPSTSGFMKPEATEALIDRINKGTLVLNYVGHGAPSLWAHERLLKESRDFDRIQNTGKLPLWVAATCDFGRFDDPLERGFAERLFVAEGRGGIAFVTSARLAYASDNTALNRQFYLQLFKKGIDSERMGVALMQAKLNNYSITNDQKYHLYGDPTMRLANPQFKASITSMTPDTLKALSEISVQGKIVQNNDLSNFQGKALLKVVDSRKLKTYYTQQNSPIRYIDPGKTIFRGMIPVSEDLFAGKFIVPKDITYGGDLGRMSVYFANADVHGIGYRDSLFVGGTSVLIDEEGPIIEIGFVDQNFSEGNVVNKSATIEIEIADSISGVNIAGDIGHNISLVLDDREDEKIILTDYFNYFEGNHKAGKILYDFSKHKFGAVIPAESSGDGYGLPEGNHTITVKAWDNFNNSAVTSSQFTVVSDDVIKLQHVLNFPNPFSSTTTFTFSVNQACDVKIKIYTINGTLIQVLDNNFAASGHNQVSWNGRDRDGDELANGVYLYKLMAKKKLDQKNIRDEVIGKFVIAR